ncbi:OprD family outer membrane porin, partial [Pseudomonas sp. CCI1.2]|uniref:OprD family outer membrane porin n=1 Tax=Pseudomonas sp. CCI1.2 TaxID=3048614 RepID=UPI002B22502C
SMNNVGRKYPNTDTLSASLYAGNLEDNSNHNNTNLNNELPNTHTHTEPNDYNNYLTPDTGDAKHRIIDNNTYTLQP